MSDIARIIARIVKAAVGIEPPRTPLANAVKMKPKNKRPKTQ